MKKIIQNFEALTIIKLQLGTKNKNKNFKGLVIVKLFIKIKNKIIRIYRD